RRREQWRPVHGGVAGRAAGARDCRAIAHVGLAAPALSRRTARTSPTFPPPSRGAHQMRAVNPDRVSPMTTISRRSMLLALAAQAVARKSGGDVRVHRKPRALASGATTSDWPSFLGPT